MELIITDLVVVQANQHNSIALKHFKGEGGIDNLAISIADHSDSGGLFHFDSPHEARTFANRIIESVEMYLP